MIVRLTVFYVKFGGPEVILTKKSRNETIVVIFSVNRTVVTDADAEPELNPNIDKSRLCCVEEYTLLWRRSPVGR